MREIPDKHSPWDAELTERETVILDAVGERAPRSAFEITQQLGVPNTFAVREAIIGQLTKLEGKGLLRSNYARGDSPRTWELTGRGRRLG